MSPFLNLGICAGMLRRTRIMGAIDLCHAWPLFLPTYSPDLDPISLRIQRTAGA
jgi:transposase